MMRIPFDIANNWDELQNVKLDIHWRTADPNDQSIIYESINMGKHWSIRINDFPDEPLHTLLIENDEVIHFDNWPQFWVKPPLPNEITR